MPVFSGFSKVRQLALYFQQYGELPDIKKKEVPPDEALGDLDSVKSWFDEFRKMDNTPEDYDPRRGHLLVAEEPYPAQVSYEGNVDVGQARLNIISMLEPDKCFDENHYLLVNNDFHSLRVHGNRYGYLLRAFHLNRLEPDKAFSQEIRFKR